MERMHFALRTLYSTYNRAGGETTAGAATNEAGSSYCQPFPMLLCRLLKGTVMYSIWWQCLLMTFYTILVVCLHNYVDGLQMHFPLSLVPVLGVVTGLLLVFRTNTAYERYWEGRKIWSAMTHHIRSLTLLVWVGVDEESENDEQQNSEAPVAPPKKSYRQAEQLIEKVSALNLLVAFVYAVKNYLRGEYSYDEDDMKDLLSHLPKLRTPSSNKPLCAQGPSYRRRKSSTLIPPSGSGAGAGLISSKQESEKDEEDDETLAQILTTNGKESRGNVHLFPPGGGEGVQINSVTNAGGAPTSAPACAMTSPVFSCSAADDADAVDSSRGNKHNRRPSSMGVGVGVGGTYKMAYDYITPSNIPIEIIYYLFSYMKVVALRGRCEPNVVRNMQWSMLCLIDCLTSFERILRTPMPMGYSVHLYYTVWIYLLALPYQLVGTLNWWYVAAVSIASFALLGILAIGGEIENPFGYDENDLPLDDFCRVIRREIQVIMGHPMPTLGSWVMSQDNHPLAPVSWLNAKELSKKSREELRDILEQGAVENVPDFTDGDDHSTHGDQDCCCHCRKRHKRRRRWWSGAGDLDS